jgi:hypothetical protein
MFCIKFIKLSTSRTYSMLSMCTACSPCHRSLQLLSIISPNQGTFSTDLIWIRNRIRSWKSYSLPTYTYPPFPYVLPSCSSAFVNFYYYPHSPLLMLTFIITLILLCFFYRSLLPSFSSASVNFYYYPNFLSDTFPFPTFFPPVPFSSLFPFSFFQFLFSYFLL